MELRNVLNVEAFDPQMKKDPEITL